MTNFSPYSKKETNNFPAVRIRDLKFKRENATSIKIEYKKLYVHREIGVCHYSWAGISQIVLTYWYEVPEWIESPVWDICFEHAFGLISTPCNFGGERFWFECTNGVKPCNRRVGVLYFKDAFFACRYCHNLTYSSQKMNRYAWEISWIHKIITLERKMKKLKSEIKRSSYAGGMTKKQQKYSQLIQQWRSMNGL